MQVNTRKLFKTHHPCKLKPTNIACILTHTHFHGTSLCTSFINAPTCFVTFPRSLKCKRNRIHKKNIAVTCVAMRRINHEKECTLAPRIQPELNAKEKQKENKEKKKNMSRREKDVIAFAHMLNSTNKYQLASQQKRKYNTYTNANTTHTRTQVHTNKHKIKHTPKTPKNTHKRTQRTHNAHTTHTHMHAHTYALIYTYLYTDAQQSINKPCTHTIIYTHSKHICA